MKFEEFLSLQYRRTVRIELVGHQQSICKSFKTIDSRDDKKKDFVKFSLYRSRLDIQLNHAIRATNSRLNPPHATLVSANSIIVLAKIFWKRSGLDYFSVFSPQQKCRNFACPIWQNNDQWLLARRFWNYYATLDSLRDSWDSLLKKWTECIWKKHTWVGSTARLRHMRSELAGVAQWHSLECM